MTPQQQAILDQKRKNLAGLKNTINADFGVLTSNSRPFQFDTPQPLPAYPAPGAGMTLLTQLRMPSNQTGKLTGIAIVNIQGAGAASGFVDGGGNVVWHVFRNGAPLRGFENLYAQVGQINSLADMALILLQNDLIQVYVEVPAGKVAPVVGNNPFSRLAGYYNFGGQGAQLPAGGSAAVPSTVVNTVVAAGGGSGSAGGVSAGHFTGGGFVGGVRRPNTN